MIDLDKPIGRQADPDWNGCACLPIIESGQPLIALGLSRRLTVYPIYHHLQVPDALPDCHIRAEVYDRLLKAASSLPNGVYLTVLDGWRPLSVQTQLFRSLSRAIAAANPQYSVEELAGLTRSFVSVPSISKEAPSPHLTGGAVDVTLTDEDGRWLDMGSEFDAACDKSYTSYYEELDEPSESDVLIRARRRLLFNAMHNAGFSNLNSEWWHYDFGNQLWAWNTGKSHAIYGCTEVESIQQRWERQLSG